ncbi:MAG: proline--tRNA ligase, partial [Leptolyngbyaceae bacterium]|nr:proline--tRNA ligase [Leptolyngbyaceae bacterium]
TFDTFEKLETPNTPTIATLSDFLKCSPTQIVKNVLYQVTYDNDMAVLVLVSIRGDQDVNETKLYNELTKIAPTYGGTSVLALDVPDAEAQKKWATQPLPLGYIAPDLSDDYIQIQSTESMADTFLRMVDQTAVDLTNFVTGSNESGYHVVGANWGEEFTLPKRVVDVRTAVAGDRAIHDSSQILQTARGIEMGHIFKLGQKYSRAMKATYTTEQGEEKPLVMGCYGIGVSRLAQAAVEQSYDKDGIIWPVAIAPYHAIVIIPNTGDEAQVAAAEKIYAELNSAGIETLLDDRNERAGVKFKDSELVGIPFRVVTGRSLKDGKVEVVKRATKESQDIPIDEVIDTLKKWIDASLTK